jgi:hypothetical protein
MLFFSSLMTCNILLVASKLWLVVGLQVVGKMFVPEIKIVLLP